MRNSVLVFGLVALAGCGGTNTNDGSTPYNRGPQGQDNQSPTGVTSNSPTQGEVVSVFAVLNGNEIFDEKQAVLVIDSLKRLPVPPKRVFILGAKASQADWLRKPLKEAKFNVIPVPGEKVDDWKKVLSSFGADKLYGNGPSNASPNIDELGSDQSKLSSHFTLDGVRFVSLNTDSPVKGTEKGAVPRLWLTGKLIEFKENHVVYLGWRAFRSLGEEDPTPFVTGGDLVGKSQKVRLFVSASAKTPTLSRPDDKSIYQMAIGGAVGEDKMPTAGIIEVRKNGTLMSKLIKLEPQKPGKEVQVVSLWEPNPVVSPTPKPKDTVPTSAANGPKKPGS